MAPTEDSARRGPQPCPADRMSRKTTTQCDTCFDFRNSRREVSDGTRIIRKAFRNELKGKIPHFSQEHEKWGYSLKPVPRNLEAYLNDLTAEASSSFTSKTV